MIPLNVLDGWKANISQARLSSKNYSPKSSQLTDFLPCMCNLVFSNRQKESHVCVPGAPPPGISFSLVICLTHSTLQVPQPPLTLISATQWDHVRAHPPVAQFGKYFQADHGAHLVCFLFPWSTILCCPLSYIWKHLTNTFSKFSRCL